MFYFEKLGKTFYKNTQVKYFTKTHNNSPSPHLVAEPPVFVVRLKILHLKNIMFENILFQNKQSINVKTKANHDFRG